MRHKLPFSDMSFLALLHDENMHSDDPSSSARSGYGSMSSSSRSSSPTPYEWHSPYSSQQQILPSLLGGGLHRSHRDFQDLEHEIAQLKMQNLVLSTENAAIKYVFQSQFIIFLNI